MEEKLKVKTEEDLLLEELLLEDLETMATPVPYMEDVIDENIREGLEERISTEEGFKDNFHLQIGMMLDLFESTSVEDMSQKADELLAKTKEAAKANQQTILQTIRPWEKTLRAINLFFQNASSSGKTKYASFAIVDPNRFAGAENPAHFNKMAEELKEIYYRWVPDKSPMYLTYIGDIGDGAGAFAQLAEETTAMVVLDTLEAGSAEATLKRTKNRNLSGAETKWGHTAISGTYLIGRGAYEGLEKQPLSIPSAAPILGKLMSTEPGSGIAGFENGAISNAKGVRYVSGTRESAEFGDRGMLILSWEEGVARIFGDTTAIQAGGKDLAEYRKISKMIVRNKIMQDMVAFCNRKAYGKWGAKESRKFKEIVHDYLNDLVRSEAIQGYQDVEVVQISEDKVEVYVNIKFYDTISRFLISVGEQSKDEQ